jgi:hypothetical protein
MSVIDNPRDYVSGAMLRGATARWQARKTLADNPYSASPGYYVLHRAWDYGFRNADEVLTLHDAAGDPDYEAPPIELPPLR